MGTCGRNTKKVVDMTPFLDALGSVYGCIENIIADHFPRQEGDANLCGSCCACCRSRLRMQISSIELLYIKRSARGRKISAFVNFINRTGASACPFHLEKKMMCSIYPARPLSCRTYGFNPLQPLERDCVFNSLKAPTVMWERIEECCEEFAALRQAFYEFLGADFAPLTALDHLFKGLLLLRRGDLDDATAQFKTASDLDPEDSLAGQFMDALADLRRLAG